MKTWFTVILLGLVGILLGACSTQGKLVDHKPIEGLEASWKGAASVGELVDAADELYLAREKARVLAAIRQTVESGATQQDAKLQELYRYLSRLEELQRQVAVASLKSCCWENNSAEKLIIELYQRPGDKKLQSLMVPEGGYLPFQQRYGRYYAKTRYLGDYQTNGYWIDIPRRGAEFSSKAQSYFNVVFTQ